LVVGEAAAEAEEAEEEVVIVEKQVQQPSWSMGMVMEMVQIQT
jgi:hypothetical protein